MLTHEALRRLLEYNGETGLFTRTGCRRGHATGLLAGCIESRGYVVIKICAKRYYAHRLAWFYVTGMWPLDQIDHINCVKHDNRWVNLRESDPSLNQQNLRRAHRRNKAGFLGVHALAGDSFESRIKINGRIIYLGTFKTPEQAHAEYVIAKRRLHPAGML